MTEESVSLSLPDEMLTFVPSLTPGWRGANLIMIVFFFLAALANMNDPDWYIWAPMYFFPSILCFVAFIHPHNIGSHVWQVCMSIELGVASAMTLYQLSKVFAIYDEMASNPLIHEEGREMGGLIIIVAWTGISRFSPFHSFDSKSKAKKNNGMTGLLVVAVTLAVVPLVTWSLCFVGEWHKHLGHCAGMFK